MANKKVFTDESLGTLVSEIKAYTDGAVSTKANTSHSHAISDVTNLQSTLDGISEKANESSLFVVNITGDDVDGFKTDTKFEDLVNAYNNDMVICLKYHTIIYQLFDADGEEFGFHFSDSLAWSDKFFLFDDGDGNIEIEYFSNRTGALLKTTNDSSLVDAINEVHDELDSHTHDDRYYTETEINTKIDTLNSAIDGKAASGHTHSNMVVKLNSGTTEGTNMFTYNGGTAKTINITPSSIGAQAAGSYAASSHNHDDRYYTETEIDTKLAGKANSSHGNHVPTTQTASNKVFLRNDNTWQTVTPANIGAAASSHTHTVANISDLTATATELNYMDGVTSNVQTQLDGKAASSHTHTKSQITDFPTSLKNPTSLTIQGNGTTLTNGVYDGSTAKTVNITPSAIGAAASSHTHGISDVTNLQSTLDGKQASITGGATTITSSNLTASRALISNSSGKVAVSDVTSTELGYLDGVTSNIQTQLDGKASSSHGTHVTYGTSATAVGTSASAGSATTVSRSDHVHSLPTASSSTLGGVKIGSNISISSGTISVPIASGTQAGVTIVYPSASCTTFSSDSGTVTPLAVQKGAKMFAITRPSSSTNKAITRYSNTTGDVQDSKIIIEDVTNTKDTSKEAQVISIPAEGGKKMVYGYCTDQTDGTSFIGGVFDASATSYPYSEGLAIGGTSGNLLWKGKRVLDNDDLTTLNTAINSKGTSNLTIGTTSTTAAAGNHTHKYAGSSSAGGSATSAVKLDTATAGSTTQPVYFTGGKPVATTYTLGKSVPSDAKFTDTTYSAATTSANGLMSSTDKTKLNNTNIAYGTCSTAAATAAKVIAVSGNTNWTLAAGSMITVLFTETNTAESPTFNVNSTGAKNVYYGANQITTGSLSYAGYASRPMTFMYDGTQYRFIGWGADSNTDTKVQQNAAITTAGAYPVILAYSTSTSKVTNAVNKTSTLTYNPSTKTLSVPNISLNGVDLGTTIGDISSALTAILGV